MKFIRKLVKLESYNIYHHSIIPINWASACYQTLEELPGPLVPEKNQRDSKMQLFFLKKTDYI